MSKPTLFTKYAASGAAASETAIGGTIPEGKVRKVTSIIVAQDGAAADTLKIYNGTIGGTKTTETKMVVVLSDNTVELGGDINNPIMVLRPEKAAGGAITLNGIYLGHTTAVIHVAMTFFDADE